MIATSFSPLPKPALEGPLLSRLPKPRSDGGFTLIELLVSTLIGLVVFGAIVGTLGTSQRVEAREAEWALTVQEGRTGLARMAREIRQASEIKTYEAGTIEFLATIGTTEWKIRYECGVQQPGTTYSYKQCVRKAVVGSSGTLPSTGVPIVRDVLNPTGVFKYFKGATSTAAPTEMNVVTLAVELPAKGTLKQAGGSGYTHNVVLENAAFIRNCNIKAC
jgi:prepilin-type N-terminal cleavage/methylation domain-containing protein